MRNRLGVAFAAAALGLICPLAAEAQERRVLEPYSPITGNVNFFLGAKALDEGDWEPVDTQAEFGILTDGRVPEWPVNLAFDFLISTDQSDAYDPFLMDTVTVTGTTLEVDLGVRKYWDPMPEMGLFVGGGVAYGWGDVEVEDFLGTSSDSGSGVGFWFDMGGFVRAAELFNVGIEFRYSVIPATIADVDTDVGGVHFGFVLGYHW